MRMSMKHTVVLSLALASSAIAGGTDSYPEDCVLVVATPGFDWAATEVSQVLDVRAVPVAMSLFDAAQVAKNDANVLGVVEVELNLSQFIETAYVICRDASGAEKWRVKRMLNFGGGQERLARDMVQGLLKKAKGKKCPA
jgi:hypothetical protein